MPDINSRIADRVRALRADAGMSLEALAGKCDVSRSMISLIERGESSPTAVVLEKIAAGLGVSLAALFELLGKRDVQGAVLEGGPTIAWSGIRDGVVDQLVLYLAPMLVGGHGAAGWLGGAGFAPIGRAARVEIVSIEHVGADLKVVADVHRDR